ncbi:class I adenylate-forming enzyme family protein [Sphingomonas abietis]|uniref:Class I adenylate-forming enzyme family protein n=1 Tax=Sphingomonas abietis TaxID=3012344 RepID=A0ABY7NJN5_9SPHN|nr:class I adenylate-forming enzyme family protein [Sphingomonas abietis]WBO21694.1 class I adenylate-forming enzyme family protein [Sphingomonas abietis]
MATEQTSIPDPLTHLPDGWPKASLGAIEAMLCAPGQPFEMQAETIRGVPTRTWKNQPPSLPALARMARAAHGDRTFIVYEEERISYEAWFRATAALAAELSELGVRRGDRVALAMRNLPEWPVIFFAAASLGAIVVPLNAWWTGAELTYGLAHSETSLLVCDAERWERIQPHLSELPLLGPVIVSRAKGELASPAIALESLIGAPPGYAALPDADLPEIAIAPDDDATIFYTSGTTGLPKGAIGTHRNILTCVMASAYAALRSVMRRGEAPALPEPKTILTVIPMFHVTACNSTLMGTLAAGHTLVFMRRWDAGQALGLIERERVNITGGVPTIAWQLLEHPDRARHDLSSLETIAYGGAPSAPDLVRRIQRDLGAAPSNGWGMTETSATVTLHVAEDYLHRPESCGPALPVSTLKIMNEDGTRELPIGEVGELWAAGPQIVKGYWRDPEATARTFIDGWVRTGDMARLDAEGFCFIVDRAKDVVIRGGENIYSTEVENALYAHPAVTDAAVIGLPHRTLGEELAAVVHLARGTSATEAELQDWVRARLAGFKVPAYIRFHPETLPRNANGKIMKKELAPLFEREREAAG